MEVITEDYFLEELKQIHERRGYNKPNPKKLYSFLDGEMHRQRDITRILLPFSKSDVISHVYRSRKKMPLLYSELVRDIRSNIKLQIRYGSSKEVYITTSLKHLLVTEIGMLMIVYRLVYLEIGDDIPVYVNRMYRLKRAHHRGLKERVINTTWKYVKDKVSRIWKP